MIAANLRWDVSMSESPDARPDDCLVTIEFRLPPSDTRLVKLLYENTTPWLQVDGGEQHDIKEWETYQMSLPPGKHRFEVGVPHQAFGTLGQAGRTVKMAAGEGVKLIYHAPRTPNGIGEVLLPGQISAAEAPWVDKVVAVIIFAVVIYLAYKFLL